MTTKEYIDKYLMVITKPNEYPLDENDKYISYYSPVDKDLYLQGYYENCKTYIIDFLAKHNITILETTFDTNVANLGFSEEENKWYGWSHRGIFGFTIGSKVKHGDCAYIPVDKNDFIEDLINFWKDEYRLNIHAENITDKGFDLVWTYSNDVPNELSRGKQGGTHEEFPKEFGKGEWEAKTIEDAKQMAIDYANAIS